MSENMKSIIYISKRCPYCRKLLLLLQNKPELKGSIQIVCIDDEPFPKIVKSVPTMVSNGEIWTADELFAALEGRPDKKQMEQQQQPQYQQQQQQQQQYQQHMQHQQQQMQSSNQTQNPQQAPQSDDMLDGYFGGSGLTGGSLGFASIDDVPSNIDESYYATLDAKDNMIDVQNDGYIQKNKKSQQFDSDYERMMAERGEIGQGTLRVGGGM